MELLDWLIDRTRSVSRYAIWASGAFLIFSVFFVGVAVVVRKLAISQIDGASEVGGYMLAICSTWAFPYTLLHRSNIRFDAVYWQSSPMLRAFFDFLGVIAIGVFAFVVTYYAVDVLLTSIELDSHSVSSLAVPLWIPQSVWLGGLIFWCWTSLILSLRCAVALLRQEVDTVFELAGLEMAKEEVERETHAADVEMDDGRGLIESERVNP
jgi:TRAP-type mannitol/chloroaromatic compound transport system permease small subunit